VVAAVLEAEAATVVAIVAPVPAPPAAATTVAAPARVPHLVVLPTLVERLVASQEMALTRRVHRRVSAGVGRVALPAIP
jgi:hypothetical protein